MKLNPFRNLFTLCLLAGVKASAEVRYVDLNSINPAPPYTSWATAATSIQDAVDAAAPGDEVVVTNGVYSTGGRRVPESSFASEITNRVVVTNALTLRSVNGPQFTFIQGDQGTPGIRCAYITDGVALSGFTLTNGGTAFPPVGYGPASEPGGGIVCEANGGLSTNCVITNCVISGNSTSSSSPGLTQVGGGVFGGRLFNCTLADNYAGGFGGGVASGYLFNCTLIRNHSGYEGGGAIGSTLIDCVLIDNTASSGGGASQSTLNNCILIGNSATGAGGGISSSTLSNCTLMNNSASNKGGGAAYATLNNCTIVGNTAGFSGGGTDFCYLTNCIVYYNTAPSYLNYNTSTFTDNRPLNYCCTTPMPVDGTGNITNAPLFVNTNGWVNLRLQSNSPCINAGTNAPVVGSTDLDGRPRIVGGTVDMGAYEFQPSVSSEFIGWLSGYGLPTDGSSDSVDSDSDRMNNWQEWIAGTVPTDALSALQFLDLVRDASGITVAWQSVTNRTYFLERATSFGVEPRFALLTSNITGQAGTTTYSDTNAVGPGPFFYRVGIQQ